MNVCNIAWTDNDYADYIISYDGNVSKLEEYFRGECLRVLDDNLAIVSLPRENIDLMRVIPQLYYMVPKCYKLMDTTNLEASGVIQVQNQPVLSLRGRGTIVGIIDTGINYQNELFRNSDGSSRILGIWDQTIAETENVNQDIVRAPYGVVYSQEDINQALMAENPLEVVPTVDSHGHGTFVAGIIAGNKDESADFTGIAPQADIMCVKLKPAKKYLRDFYFIVSNNLQANVEAEFYQETDIMQAVYYLLQSARKLDRPISIYIGMGSNHGDHSGNGPLNDYLTRVSQFPGVVVSVPAGNEGNARHHASGVVTASAPYQEVELNIGANERGITIELWGDSPGIYAIGFQTPLGEVVDRIQPRFMTYQKIPLFLERTTLEVAYVFVEEYSGRQLIYIRMVEPTEGIWKLRIYATGNLYNAFDIWLPVQGNIQDDTYFLVPNPLTTLTNLATADGPISTAAYNHLTNALFFESGRGYTSIRLVKPDIAAPGVDIYGPGLVTGEYVRKSGTSIATAHTAGAAALVMEWALNRGNVPRLNGVQIKRFLVRGADRNRATDYPNEAWGYGTLNIYGTFETLQQRSN